MTDKPFYVGLEAGGCPAYRYDRYTYHYHGRSLLVLNTIGVSSNIWWAVLFGAAGGVVIGLITEYYTSAAPVIRIAEAGKTSPATANENLPTLHRYFRLKQRMLGIEKLHYHDLDVEPDAIQKRFSVEDAMELTRAAVEVFGDRYVAALDSGFSGRWMHARIQEGKQPGGYTAGIAYDVHPYVLLNFREDFRSVSTFAHEWGHAVHSVLAMENQPFHLAEYSKFVAETASIANEILLRKEMVRRAKSEDKVAFLALSLEQMRTHFFRQAMLSEFEAQSHDLAARGEPITGQVLSDLYLEILKRYHGHAADVVHISPESASEWMSVPLYYNDFYVYQFATAYAGGALRTPAAGPDDVPCATASYG